MKIDIIRKVPEDMDCLIIFQDENGRLDSVELLPPELAKLIQAYIKKEDYQFAYASLANFTVINGTQRQNIILLGGGNKNELNTNKVRQLLGSAIRLAGKLKAKQIFLFQGFNCPISEVAFGHVLAESALIVSYRFNKYLSKGKDDSEIEALHYMFLSKNTRHLNRGIVEGRIYAETTNYARNLVNEPANVITPETLAETAKQAALQYGFSIDVHSLDKLKRIKMDAFLAVGRGSVHEPKLIIMRHLGNPDHHQDTIALIGKGITFDSGGYCIKSAQECPI